MTFREVQPTVIRPSATCRAVEAYYSADHRGDGNRGRFLDGAHVPASGTS